MMSRTKKMSTVITAMLVAVLSAVTALACLDTGRMTAGAEPVTSFDEIVTGGTAFDTQVEYDSVTVKDAQGGDIDGATYSGLLITPAAGDVIDLGVYDITTLGKDKPVISVLPQLQDKGVNSAGYYGSVGQLSDEWYSSTEITAINIRLTSGKKELTYRMEPRGAGSNNQDPSGELGIIAGGENQTLGSNQWHDGSLNNGGLGSTQKYRLNGTSCTRDVVDENGAAVTHPHPIDLYYDYTANIAYVGSVVKGNGFESIKETTASGKNRYKIRDLSVGTFGSPWTKFSEEEAKNVHISIEVENTKRTAGQVLVTCVGGEDADEGYTRRSLGLSRIMTADDTLAFDNDVILADNDLETPLFDFSMAPTMTGLEYTPSGDAAAMSDIRKNRIKSEAQEVILEIGDGTDTLAIHYASRDDGTACSQINTWALYNGAPVGRNSAIIAAPAIAQNESTYSFDNRTRANALNEFNQTTYATYAQSKFAIYYDPDTNALYTDNGRATGITVEGEYKKFMSSTGSELYRWLLCDLDDIAAPAGAPSRNSATDTFRGFGARPVKLSIKVVPRSDDQVTCESAGIRIHSLDGQYFRYDKDGSIEAAKSGNRYLKEEVVTAKTGETVTLPSLYTRTLLGGDVAADEGVEKTLTDGSVGKIVGGGFSSDVVGDAVVEYKQGDETIASLRIRVGEEVAKTNAASAFVKTGTTQDNVSFEYGKLPTYMKFEGGGMLVTTSGTAATGANGLKGLGVETKESVYVGGGRFGSASDCHSFISLAFPGTDDHKGEAQATAYRVTLTDHADETKYITVVISAGDGGAAQAAAIGSWELDGALANASAGHDVLGTFDGSSVPVGALLNANSADPLELVLDATTKRLWAIAGSRAVLIRDFAATSKSEDKFGGFTDGRAKIAVGVDVSATFDGDARFAVLGVGGVDLTENREGYFLDFSGRLELDGKFIAGDEISLGGLAQRTIFGSTADMTGGRVSVTDPDAGEALSPTDLGADAKFTADKAGTYTITYTKDAITLTGHITVSPSIRLAVTGTHGTVTVDGKQLASGDRTLAKADSAVLLAPDAGYEASATVRGTAASPVEGAFTIIATAEDDIIELAVTFSPRQYTITYNDGEGSITSSDHTVNFTVEDTQIKLPTVDAPQYYDFAGWFRGEDKVEDGAYTFAPGGFTLEAHYAPHEYTVTYELNYDDSVAETDTVTVLTQSAFEFKERPDVPKPGNWYFEGWYTAADGGSPVTELAELKDTTVYAHWSEGYTVTFEVNGTVTGTENVRANTAVEQPEAPELKGHDFQRWELDGEEYDFSDPVNDNITLKAVFTPKHYELEFVVDGEVAATVGADYGTKALAGAPELPAKAGHTARWSVDDDTLVEGDMRIVAIYTPETYTVTFDSDGGSAVEPLTVGYGEFIVAPAAPTKEGYTFGGWFEEGSDTAYVFGSTASGNVSLKARWVPVAGEQNGTDDKENNTGCSGCAGAAAAVPALLALLGVAIIGKRG